MDHNVFLCLFINTFAYSLYCVNVNLTYLQCAKLVRKLYFEVRIPVIIKEKIAKNTQRMLKKSSTNKKCRQRTIQSNLFPGENPLWFLYVISNFTTQQKYAELLIDFSWINQCTKTGVEAI